MTLAPWDRPALAPRFPAQEHSLLGWLWCGAGRRAAALWPSQATTTPNLSVGTSRSPDLRGSEWSSPWRDDTQEATEGFKGSLGSAP